MADASLGARPVPDRRTILLADPRPGRLRPVGTALAREFAVEVAADGGSAFEAAACGRCFLAVVAMSLPALSGLEVLRRLAALRLQQPPLVLALGEADDVRLKVVETHGLAQGTQLVPCPPGVDSPSWQQTRPSSQLPCTPPSKMTGAPVVRARIGSARMSEISML